MSRTTAGTLSRRRRRAVIGTGVIAVVIVSVCATVFTTRASAATASDYGYPYPNAPDCDEQAGANCLCDMWGMTQGQCHSWVAYRLNELNAAALNGQTFTNTYKQPAGQVWGGGGQWRDAAIRAGI